MWGSSLNGSDRLARVCCFVIFSPSCRMKGNEGPVGFSGETPILCNGRTFILDLCYSMDIEFYGGLDTLSSGNYKWNRGKHVKRRPALPLLPG